MEKTTCWHHPVCSGWSKNCPNFAAVLKGVLNYTPTPSCFSLLQAKRTQLGSLALGLLQPTSPDAHATQVLPISAAVADSDFCMLKSSEQGTGTKREKRSDNMAQSRPLMQERSGIEEENIRGTANVLDTDMLHHVPGERLLFSSLKDQKLPLRSSRILRQNSILPVAKGF